MCLDPSTGKVIAATPVASGPRFFDVGLVRSG
jgi:hypothetical protein